MSKSNALTRAKKRHALACVQADLVNEALGLYRKVCEIDPQDVESWYMAGTLFGRLGRFPEAEDALRKAVELQPNFAQGYLHLGQALELQAKFAEAEGCYTHALSLKPDWAEGHDALGRLCQLRGDMHAAVGFHQRAIELNPSRVPAYLSLARAQQQLGALDAASANIEHALRLDPQYAEAYYDLAGVRVGQGRYDDALRCIRQAQQLKPDYVEAIAVEAYVLDHQKDYQGALNCIRPVLDRYRGYPEVALVYAQLCHFTGDYVGAIARLEDLQNRQGLTDDHRYKIHFHLGALYDKRGEFAKAFAQFESGNVLKRARFDRGAWEDKITDLMAVFHRDALARASRAGNCSERPIFIVGIPRSGTTLVEQMLSMLPEVAAAGELPDMGMLAGEFQLMLENTSPANNLTQISREQCDGLAQRYLDVLEGKFPAAKRVTDKMPHNFLHLGLIALLFPMARVIHCMRDPYDTCLSCYFQDFTGDHPYSYDLADLGFYHRQYHRLMEHWRKSLDVPFFEINYEDLVREPKSYGKALVEFCGLKWDPRCLEFYQGANPAATASFQQVRQPVYTTSIGRWRNYADFLEPLKRALGESLPHL
jgi:tetratricopeptide (TPR) repeat protein